MRQAQLPLAHRPCVCISSTCQNRRSSRLPITPVPTLRRDQQDLSTLVPQLLAQYEFISDMVIVMCGDAHPSAAGSSPTGQQAVAATAVGVPGKFQHCSKNSPTLTDQYPPIVQHNLRSTWRAGLCPWPVLWPGLSHEAPEGCARPAGCMPHIRPHHSCSTRPLQ
jgi:hypothetical protein